MPTEVPITVDRSLLEATAIQPKKLFVEVAWAEDGMAVFIPWPTPEKPRQGLRCTVAVACGDVARVVNEQFNVDRWFRLESLYVPDDDVHGLGYRR
jgi:hypothetical protein